MKGIINIIEVMTVGIILLMALVFFFPRYTIRSKWSSAILSIKARDTLNTIELMNKTFIFAKNQTAFENFMQNIFTPSTSGALIWWKNIQSPDPYFLIDNGIVNLPLPYFTEAQKETIIDIGLSPDENFVNSNTVALWHFNESGGMTANDESPNNNDGRLINMEDDNWVDGRFGNGLYFDEINEYVNISDHPSLRITQNITMDLWFKTDRSQRFKFLLERENETGDYLWGLYLTEYSTYLEVYITDSNGNREHVTITGNWNNSQWYYFAGTFDGRYIRLYVNGTKMNEIDWGPGHTISSQPGLTYIGAWPGNNLQLFNGTIDEVRILNRALSEKEIQAEYNKQHAYSFTLGLGYPY